MVSSDPYRHRLGGQDVDLPLGKIVCIGRNYIDHAKELNNPVPAEPILFIKPATALVQLEQLFSIPQDRGECHFETELAILIGEQLTNATQLQAQSSVAGIGVALDLTLRDLQSQLKEEGHPWEKAKAFDGSCPVSGFVRFNGDLQDLNISLSKNGVVQQNGNTGDMITPVLALLAHVSTHFTLMPGDIVLTGTPAGVGVVESGDKLTVELDGLIEVNTGAL